MDPLWHAESPLKYLGIDAGNGEGSLYPKLKDRIDSYSFAEVINADYKEVLRFLGSTYDLVIVDIGRPSDNLVLLNSLIPIINPGGTLVLHEPLEVQPFNISGRRVVQRGYSIAWNLLKVFPQEAFETLTLPEFHKTAQAGVGILRKKTKFEQTRDPKHLLKELQTCQDVPTGNLEHFREISSSSERRLLDVIRDKSFLQIMALSTLGEISAPQIAKQLGISVKKVQKHISNLEDLGINLEDTSPLDSVLNRRISELPDSSSILKLTHADYTRISNYLFLQDRLYTEKTVNWILSHVQSDYAELRRRLVDLGLLTRENNSQTYRRE
ncbi:DUF2087 domain-containing protein [Corynebacterium anserum]|uniref:DUF2087 domain-containing protein n=1 Tax=Corynebacterium anserum TaxID=2684406 RepID=A0A7G7YLV6_9CORY|nr:DUF2087 domain-containing protein [Corynebacterium anserum]QNH95476.1 DUF2087 domain-containing protein [Corynebacterium anserum]